MSATASTAVPGLRKLKLVGQRVTIDTLDGKYITIREFIELPNTKFGPADGTYCRITAEVTGKGKIVTFNASSPAIKQTLTNAQNNLPIQLKVCKVLSGNGFYYWTLQP